MTAIVSFVFDTLCFPHEGKIVTIYQLSFSHASPNASVGSSIPVIKIYQPKTKDIGVIMYSSLMGTFDFMAPIHHIYAMSSRSSSLMRFVPFCTSYFNDTWNLPSPTMSYEGQSYIGMEMPPSVVEVVYQVVINTIVDLDHVSS
jgi:hypothetical protein